MSSWKMRKSKNVLVNSESIIGQGEDVKSEPVFGINGRLHCHRIVVAVLIALVCTCYSSAQTRLTVSAAASLTNALAETEAAYKRAQANIEFSNNIGSSGTLAAQIDQGAPVDIFISAASKPMDDLAASGLIVTGTRRNLLRNTLVLIAPLDSKLKDFQGLTDRSIRMIALGDPESVPAGQYGKQTLLSFHLWEQLSAKFVLGKDARQVLTYVVYATDAQASGKVRVVATAPESAHDLIVYPVAVVKGSRNEEASRKFVEFLPSPIAQAIFVKHGFTIAAP
jgi:molybdate transport system substrate-binding protein